MTKSYWFNASIKGKNQNVQTAYNHMQTDKCLKYATGTNQQLTIIKTRLS